MKSEDYWAHRMEDLNEAELRKGEAYIKTQNAEFDKAMASIRKETEDWYARLAKNNEISMAEARKLLTDNELKEFHWTVDDYIKAGRENAIDQRWMKQLENAGAKVHISRLEELQMKLQQEIELLSARRVKGSTEVLGEIYKDGYYKGIFEVQRGVGEGVPFAQLDARQIDKVLTKPWAPDGRNFSARIWGERDKLLSELQTVLEQDLLGGEPSDKVIADFAKRMGVSKSVAERLILTESAYFSGQSRIDGYKQQGVKAYKFVATLDKRTSAQCRRMDGEVIPLSEAKPGVNYPPLHAYCRSTTIPVFDDEVETEPGERAARGNSGKTYSVPSNMTYKNWTAKHAPKDADKPPKAAEPEPVTPPTVKTAAPEDNTTLPELNDKQPEPLTHGEEAAVSRYIGGESYVLNDKLRRGQPLESKEMEWIEELDKALNKLPPFEGDVSRSLQFSSEESLEEFMTDIRPGAVLQYPQYISTTAGAIYNPDGQVQMIILGARQGRDITLYNPGEQEILYWRNFGFEVVEVQFVNGVYYILMREVGQ
ncbi:minor capsid protein [Paenibacillus lautus]|uniref:minor capsid protein n=1 Tax=Paenibacillus lautus TaxID=1401 RepID=UPI002DC02C36|nr:minor capsid protein [Paenibacillus lautus]MEC0310170.1 minor capsid protein [Paenibacillus lautus]